MGIGNRIKEARNNLGYTQEKLAELLGVTKGAVANYENETSHPKEPIMYKLIETLNVDANYLFQDCVKLPKEVNDVTLAEYKHIKKYRSLDPHGRDMVDTVLQKEVERMESLKKEPASNPTAHIYPYLGKIACAGTGFYFDDIPTDTIEAPYVEGADFIIGVSGESMEPDYHDGEKLYVRKVEYLRNGDVGIFTIGNQCFLKELGEDGLISRNKNYDDIPGDEKVRLIGKVIGKVE